MSAEEAQMNASVASEEEEVMERKCVKRWPGCHHPWKKCFKRHPHPFGMMSLFPPPFMSEEDSEEEECPKEKCSKMKQEKEEDNEEKVKCTCTCDECKAVREFLKHKMMRRCGPHHMWGPPRPHMFGPHPHHMWGPPHPHMFGPPPPPHMWGLHHRRHRHMGPFPW